MKIEMIYVYKDKTKKIEEVSMWHGNRPFAFIDDDNLNYIVIHGNHCKTQEELDMFFKGIQLVRDNFISLLN